MPECLNAAGPPILHSSIQASTIAARRSRQKDIPVRPFARGTGIALASRVAIMWDPWGGSALRRDDKPTQDRLQESISIGASVLAALVALKVTPMTAGSGPSDERPADALPGQSART